MNFKRFGRTTNLFDEANLEGGIYLASNGNKYGSITDGVRSGVKINVLPNTQYTLSLYSNMNISIRILQWSGETYITHTPKYNVSGNVSLTITTNSTTDKIAFNVEGVNGQYAENLMLNEGSTALPYQPYMDWTNIPHYIHNTSTDTITTLPADLYADGNNATVGLKGNMYQASGVSPDNPIMPQGTGERTGNLFDFERLKNAPSGTIGSITFSHVLTLQLKANTYYTMASNGTGSTSSTPADLYRSVYFNLTTGESSVNKNNPVTVLTDNTGVVRIGFFSERTNAQQYLNGEAQLWINEGSTALPYEPYGYFIEIEVS